MYRISIFVKKRTAVFEDTTMAYNRWVQGIAARDQNAVPTSLAKLLGLSDDNNQYPNNAKTLRGLHPLLDGIPTIAGEAFLSLANMKQKVDAALASNLGQSKENKEVLLAIRRQILRTVKSLKLTIKLLERL